MGLTSSTAAAAAKSSSTPNLFADLPATFTANGILAGREASQLAHDQVQAHGICASAAAVPLREFKKEIVHDATKQVLACAALALPETAPPLSVGARYLVDQEFNRRDLFFFSPTDASATQRVAGAVVAAYMICAKTDRFKL